MKVAMLAPFGIHPKGTVFSRLLPMAHSLAGKGHEIVILMPQKEEVSITTPVGEGSLRLLAVPTGKRRYATDDLKVSCEMLRKLSSFAPDVLHVFKPKGYGGLAVMLEKARASVCVSSTPIVVDGDDYEGFGGMNDIMDYTYPEKIFFHFQERFLPPICDRMTLASRYLMEYYYNFGAKRENMIHLPNGVNPFIHNPERIDKGLMKFLSKHPLDGEASGFDVDISAVKDGDLASTDGKFDDLVPEETISLFTRFRDHGAASVLNIFRNVQEQNPRAKFLLVGNGTKGESVDLRRGMNNHLKKGSFQFTGTFPFSSLHEIFSHSDIAMVPMDDSNITRSKCSAKLVDLMAMGKAVVADDVGENGNYIEDGLSGILVNNIVQGSPGGEKMGPLCRNDSEKKNTEEFTDKLVCLLDNSDEAKRLGRQAKNRILENYSWGLLTDKLENLYREIY